MISSAAILLYRRGTVGLEVWIGHMGGPFWARKDEHAWSLPKGEYQPEEEPLAAALREFAEEMGTQAPEAEYLLLGSFRQSAQKTVTFELEWPRGSGTVREYPEIDRAGWFPEAVARRKLVKGQAQVLDALLRVLAEAGS
ncbi:NUDIX domain-containing protein [Arthrobacter sp. zg-Y238]|uniref:NUDIX domain-containing protein n=1 Tax=Arthrobacter sp. zg-Y238 TaxID=2964614 RepID=UPI002105CB0F|nr:NUDIX domain-containing protein [Arthrobacter sp. zg-Y238]MCQ1953598.1 NUDIX domain-containing protein [Arthrobacter sp. zg-Y238]